MITWTNVSKNTTTWLTRMGFLVQENGWSLILQEDGFSLRLEDKTDVSITWSEQSKNTASWTHQSKL